MSDKPINKLLTALLSGLFVYGLGFSGAFANETPDAQLRTLSPATTSTPENSGETISAENQKAATPPSVQTDTTKPIQVDDKSHRNIARKLTAFTVGVAVNTPKAIVRKSKEETISDTQELIGDHKNPALVGAAGALSVPFGITSGICEGVTIGLVRSWKHSDVKTTSPSGSGAADLPTK
jgi:hypothetical protein